MDIKRFRKKYFYAVLSSPITLVPFIGGMFCAAAAAVSESTSLGLIGVTGVLAGVGAFVYRFLVSPSDKIAQKAQKEIEREDNEEREAYLNNLRKQLDSKTRVLLTNLLELYKEFTENKEWQEGADRYSVSETLSKVKEIFQHSLTSFEKIIELKERSENTRISEIRRKYDNRIKQILSSLEEGVGILKNTLAGYHEIAASQDVSENTASISKIGEELDRHLRIAAEVSKKFSRPDSVDLEKEKAVQP